MWVLDENVSASGGGEEETGLQPSLPLADKGQGVDAARDSTVKGDLAEVYLASLSQYLICLLL